MIATKPTPNEVVTDAWIAASWDEFVAIAQHPNFDKARAYYDNGYMRVEMAPVGPLHGRDNSVIARAVSLFATVKYIRVVEYLNTSFRKSSLQECQPDIAYYIGSDLRLPPRNNSPVNVDEFDPPTLAIEISSTTLNEDLGHKRLLYERLGVQEYWVVDVNAGKVIAFEMKDGWSHQVQDSQVLLGLAIATLEEALQRSQTEDDGAINRWLLEKFNS